MAGQYGSTYIAADSAFSASIYFNVDNVKVDPTNLSISFNWHWSLTHTRSDGSYFNGTTRPKSGKLEISANGKVIATHWIPFTKGAKKGTVEANLSNSYTVKFNSGGDKSFSVVATLSQGEELKNQWGNSLDASWNGRWQWNRISDTVTGTLGTKPKMGSVTAPTTGIWSENTTSVTVKWNKASSYSGNGRYGIGLSKNSGQWEWKYPDTGLNSSNLNRTSYSFPVSVSQGDTLKFAVCAENEQGWSSYSYSQVITINKLSPPSCSNIAYNPFENSSLVINFSGGSQTSGKQVARMVSIWEGTWDKCIWTASDYWNSIPYENTSITIPTDQIDWVNNIGKNAHSKTYSLHIWTENELRSQSENSYANLNVNLASPNGAKVTLDLPVIQGGISPYSNTCFVQNVTNVSVSVPNAQLHHAPSGVTTSYEIIVNDGEHRFIGQSGSFIPKDASNYKIETIARDSRGLSVSRVNIIHVQPYYRPRISNLQIMRQENPNTNAQMTYDLYYSPIYSYFNSDGDKGTQINGISYQHYQLNNSGNWIDCSTTSGKIIKGLETDLIYNVSVRIADKIKSDNYYYEASQVGTININFAFRKNGLGINCVPQSNYALEVNGNTKFKGKIEEIFPIGSIYITVNNTNPSTYFGGKWRIFGRGRTLLGCDDGVEGTLSPKTKGGARTHTLAIDELPPHRHTFGGQEWYGIDKIKTESTIYSWKSNRGGVTSPTFARDVEDTGGGKAFDIMPPYIGVWFWERYE